MKHRRETSEKQAQHQRLSEHITAPPFENQNARQNVASNMQQCTGLKQWTHPWLSQVRLCNRDSYQQCRSTGILSFPLRLVKRNYESWRNATGLQKMLCRKFYRIPNQCYDKMCKCHVSPFHFFLITEYRHTAFLNPVTGYIYIHACSQSLST